MPQLKILCVCPDDATKQHRCMALTAEGYEVVCTTALKHAAQLLSMEQFDLLTLSVHFPDDERWWLAALAKDKHQVPIVLVSDGMSIDTDEALRKAAATILNQKRPTVLRASAGGHGK